MQILEAISAIEHTDISEHLAKARPVLEEHLAKLPENDYDNRGTYYYYLLRISLETHMLFENDLERHFYEQLCSCFRHQEEEYLREYQQNPDDKVLLSRITEFYRLMERYFTTLQVSYRSKNFQNAEQRAYLEKMRYRQRAFKFTKKRFSAFVYKLWELTSLYNLSFLRWGVSCLITILFYSLVYIVFDGLLHTVPEVEAHWYDAIHFSIATFTTLGFGDVVPGTLFARIVSDIEVFTGYLMLGAFMGLVQKRAF